MIICYLIAIVLANLSVAQFGPSVAVFNAFLFIGLDLTARDSLHERWHGMHLRRNMALLIASGSVLSYALNAKAGRIALASFVAFAGAASVDTLIYSVLHQRRKFERVNGSNVVSAGVDSLLFPALAFGFPLLWSVMAGQFVAKVSGGFMWSVILEIVNQRRYIRRKTSV